MTKFKQAGFALFATASLVIASCSGDDSVGVTPLTGNYLTAKVNGSDFNASIMGQSTVTALRTGTGNQTLIMVGGSNQQIENISIQMMGITTAGTYQVTPESDGTLLAFVNGNSSTSYDTSDCSGATGTIVVTAINDEMVEGTFSFTGKVDEDCSQSRSVTDGQFRGEFMN